MKDWQRARRDLLKRLGVGLACLPLLHARRSWSAPPAPRRLMIIQLNHGYRQMYWKPPVGPLDQPLPDSCAPLEPHRQDLVFLPDLALAGVPETVSGHAAFGVMFHGLPAAEGPGGFREPKGMTLDGVVGAGLERQPGGRASLTVGVQVDRSPRAPDYPGARRCFWAGAGQPIDPVADPNLVYGEIFAGSPGPDAGPARRLMVRRKSILDYVGSNLEDFQRRAGSEDRPAIAAHLQSLRELELRLQSGTAIAACGSNSTPTPIDLADPARYADLLDAHLRLMIAALKCGVTGVAALQTSDASAKSVYCGMFIPGVPVRAGSFIIPYRTWHDVAHNPFMNGVDHKRMVDKWFLSRFADLLAQMKGIPDGAGSFLDNTIVLLGNPMHEGTDHDARRMPWMLAGNCGGYLATGACLDSAGRSSSEVMASICQALGVKHPYGRELPGLKRI